MVPDCTKVNYKCNYQPGIILCPRTKQPLMYDNCKELISVYKGLAIEDKRQMPYL